ncbi:MAG TPA: hypothetical protein VE549_05635 [Myxococcaceae bacterium]|nr:hypothetical protein [Myxococcaceae bacterium]
MKTFACIGALAVACAWQLHDLERVLDLGLWDEADYLRRGLALLNRGLAPAEWGPLYSLWYFALSRLQPDPIALYYLSYRLLVAVPTFAVYACARRLGVSPAIALLGAVLFLISGAPHVMPRPTLLALAIVLIALAAAVRVGATESFYAAMGVALLLAAFARPELFLSFLAASGAWVVAMVLRARASDGWARPARVGAWYAAGSLALVGVFGNPFGNQDDRRMYAFCQHFADGEVKRSGLAIDPWAQCEAAVQRAFGEVDSIADAGRRNPAAFGRHVTYNLREYPRASATLFLPAFGKAREGTEPWEFGSLAHGVALLLVGVWVAWALVRGGVELVESARSPQVRRAAFVLAAILAPSAASAILIQPRSHYLVLQGVLIPLVAAAWLSAAMARRAWPVERLRSIAVVGMAIAVAIAAPHLSRRDQPEPVLVNREMVRFLESTSGDLRPAPGFSTVGILEMEGGLDAYARGNFRQIRPSKRLAGETFRQFLEREGVRVIVLSPKLASHHQLAADPEFQKFVAAPEEFGFSACEVSGVGRTVAVASDGGRPPRAGVLLSAPARDPG